MVPTIKVLVTFTKFEEIDAGDEFKTPPSSPTASGNDESPAAATEFKNSSSSSWFRSSRANKDGLSSKCHTLQDPFAIPAGYTWVSLESKKRKNEKQKPKKGKKAEQS